MKTDPMLGEHLERYAASRSSAWPPRYEGFKFPTPQGTVTVGVASLQDVPAYGILTSIATYRYSQPPINIVTGAKNGVDLSLPLAAFVAGLGLNGIIPKAGMSFADVFEATQSPYTDAVLVEPFPFELNEFIPGHCLYLLPITSIDRRVLAMQGVEAFETAQITSRRDVFSLPQHNA